MTATKLCLRNTGAIRNSICQKKIKQKEINKTNKIPPNKNKEPSPPKKITKPKQKNSQTIIKQKQKPPPPKNQADKTVGLLL